MKGSWRESESERAKGRSSETRNGKRERVKGSMRVWVGRLLFPPFVFIKYISKIFFKKSSIVKMRGKNVLHISIHERHNLQHQNRVLPLP